MRLWGKSAAPVQEPEHLRRPLRPLPLPLLELLLDEAAAAQKGEPTNKNIDATSDAKSLAKSGMSLSGTSPKPNQTPERDEESNADRNEADDADGDGDLGPIHAMDLS
jgi:hypothetical protein